jgi:GH15 family glucan-1,4-alpha-glucosidase
LNSEEKGTVTAIADHGLIGDLRTAALVTRDGTIDWLCVPRFDSASVFCALLDPARGGEWRLAPTCEVSTTHQFHFPGSNVLITRFLTEDGVAEVRDFMPLGPETTRRLAACCGSSSPSVARWSCAR